MSSASRKTLTATENSDCALHEPAWSAQKQVLEKMELSVYSQENDDSQDKAGKCSIEGEGHQEQYL